LRQHAAERHDEPQRETEKSVRRCVLTRERRAKDDLIRFVLGPDGTIVPDLKERLPGRGMWLTAARDTVAEAAKRNAFARALKADVNVPAALADQLDGLLSAAALGALALANKAGEVVFGFAKIEEAIAKGRTVALLHASEAAEDGCRKLDDKFRANPQGPHIPAIRLFSTDGLGLASGRTNVIHAAMIHGGAARNFLAAVSRLERYREGSAAFASQNGPGTDKE
jgi:uncharacterized protein